jgi:hypothetical protein
MSDPLAERLSRFTPDAAGMDRDGLLFAAGRASAQTSRRWQLIAGLLAATQLLTLVALLFRPATAPSDPGQKVVAEAPPRVAPESLPSAALNRELRDLERDESSAIMLDPIPPDPPLRAFNTSAELPLN